MPSLNFVIGAKGPLISIGIGISQAKRAVLPAPWPAVQVVTALIDTGASHTMIDNSLIAPLGLTPTGQCNIVTPSTGATPVVLYTYDVSVWLVGTQGGPPLESAVGVTATDLDHQGFQVLLGRDALDRCILLYDGKAKTGVLAF